MHSMVGMDGAARSGLAVADGHIQRIDHQRGICLRVHRPAHDPAAERIQDSAAVQPSFSCAVLRYVIDPQLIWSQSVELAIDQIVGGGHAT